MRVHHHKAAGADFELAFAKPATSLTGIVHEYVGWIDRSSLPVALRELPSVNVPLIIYLQGGVEGRDAFTAGLHDTATIVQSSGPTAAVQVNLTALGARLLFNVPLANLANRTVGLDQFFAAPARRLQAMLRDAGTWNERFAVLEREITTRVRAARSPPAEVTWVWQQLIRTAGQAKIGALSAKIGWSERYLRRRFAHDIGATPKAFARVLRFDRAVRRLTREAEVKLVDVALDCGYYDQAHFAHDFRIFAGVTATELLASRRPAESGFSALAGE